MLKAFKYRLYPDKESSVLLNKRLGCARWVYNYRLHSKMEAYNNDGFSISCIDIANRLPELKQDFTGGLLFIPKLKKGIKKPVSENKAIGIDFLQKTTSTLLG